MRIIDKTILASLNTLDGYGTVKAIARRSGYAEEYVRSALSALRDEGIVQATTHNPKIWSKVGRPLVPKPELSVDLYVTKKLAVLVKRLYPDIKPHHALRGRSSNNITLVKLLELADIAGYKLVAIPKTGGE